MRVYACESRAVCDNGFFSLSFKIVSMGLRIAWEFMPAAVDCPLLSVASRSLLAGCRK